MAEELGSRARGRHSPEDHQTPVPPPSVGVSDRDILDSFIRDNLPTNDQTPPFFPGPNQQPALRESSHSVTPRPQPDEMGSRLFVRRGPAGTLTFSHLAYGEVPRNSNDFEPQSSMTHPGRNEHPRRRQAVVNDHVFVNYTPDNPHSPDTSTAARTAFGQEHGQAFESPNIIAPPNSPNNWIARQPDAMDHILSQEPTEAIGPAAETKACAICLEVFEGSETIAAMFSFHCNKCAQEPFCQNCINDWFLDACRNQSKMPPKCCSIISVAAVAGHLSTAEIDLYKEKFEEWTTADRIYCPVPSCSAFIPPRLYIQPMASPTSVHSRPQAMNGESSTQTPRLTTTKRQCVGCPKCHMVICTTCRGSSHIGACPETDLDSGLSETLTRLKIKRCPKCRAGIRKMFGCSHVNCLCGAHFCFGCLAPFSQCGGDCGLDPDDEEDVDGDITNDDLGPIEDLDAGYDDDNGHDFGDDPVASSADQWGCLHQWSAPEKPYVTTPGEYQKGVCSSCFRTLEFSGYDNPPPATYTGWECEICEQQICGDCKEIRS